MKRPHGHLPPEVGPSAQHLDIFFYGIFGVEAQRQQITLWGDSPCLHLND